MRRYRVLDLFCGGGGAALGIHRAGFDTIVGIDIKPHPNYPFDFIQADALVPPVDIMGFDFIWASPPCQAFSAGSFCRKEKRKRHPNLIPATRELIKRHPFTCIENVPLAPIQPTVILTGPTVGLNKIQRKRHFETSFFMLQPPVVNVPRGSWEAGKAVTITKSLGAQSHFYPRKAMGLPGRLRIWEAKAAMGIPDAQPMTAAEIGEAVPPAYASLSRQKC